MKNVGSHRLRCAGRRSNEERGKDNTHRFCSIRCFWSKPINPNQVEQFQGMEYEQDDSYILKFYCYAYIYTLIVMLKFLLHMFLLHRFYVFVTVVCYVPFLLSGWGCTTKLTAPLFLFCHTHFPILLHRGPYTEHSLLPPLSYFSLSLGNHSECFPIFLSVNHNIPYICIKIF